VQDLIGNLPIGQQVISRIFQNFWKLRKTQSFDCAIRRLCPVLVFETEWELLFLRARVSVTIASGLAGS